MPLKKAEMEDHAWQYASLLEKAKSAILQGLTRQAVDLAFKSLPYIDGMMQYGKRYCSTSFETVEAIEIILEFAPLLLDFKSLELLRSLLNDKRRIERDTSVDIGEKLEKAVAQLKQVHAVLDRLEQKGAVEVLDLRSMFGKNWRQAENIQSNLLRMGLLKKVETGGKTILSLSTRLGQIVRAKCPECGEVADGPKGIFLEESACPRCAKSVLFVLLDLS